MVENEFNQKVSCARKVNTCLPNSATTVISRGSSANSLQLEHHNKMELQSAKIEHY